MIHWSSLLLGAYITGFGLSYYMALEMVFSMENCPEWQKHLMSCVLALVWPIPAAITAFHFVKEVIFRS